MPMYNKYMYACIYRHIYGMAIKIQPSPCISLIKGKVLDMAFCLYIGKT